MAAEPITNRALNRATLARQGLLERARVPVAEAVARIGPLQAQEPKLPFVALAGRLEGFEPAELVEALRSGELVRAVWIRATLHVLTAADHRALRATIQAPLSAAAARVADARDVTIDPAAVAAAAREQLAGGPLDFDALRERLAAAFPAARSGRSATWRGCTWRSPSSRPPIAGASRAAGASPPPRPTASRGRSCWRAATSPRSARRAPRT